MKHPEQDAPRPTMVDVSRAAGVSPTTVSLVLNGRDGKISKATRDRVLATVADLDYRPNRAAQSLRLGKTSTIGFLTDEIAIEPFSGPMIAGIHDLAWEQRCLLLMVNTTRNPSRLRTAVKDLLDRQVDALIFAAMGTRQVEFPDVSTSVPTLLVNAFTRDGRLPSILPDELAGGRAAVEHVLAMGHSRIAFIAGRESAWATGMRIQGYREGLEAAGHDPARHPIYLGNYRIDSGYELTFQVMQAKKPPTALLLGNDQMATGAYLALARLGVRIPDDVSVVGYDDEPIAADSRRRSPPCASLSTRWDGLQPSTFSPARSRNCRRVPSSRARSSTAPPPILRPGNSSNTTDGVKVGARLDAG